MADAEMSSGMRSNADFGVPRLPLLMPSGNYPAVEAVRVLLARKLIAARREAGLSQAELARRAGVRAETINRLEKGHHTPDAATFGKIERVLAKVGKTKRGGRKAV